MNDTDLQLLARYTRQNAEDAFAEIVRRHLDLVFSAALRQVRSPQLAEEVAQSAFIDLARQARLLAPDTILAAWLYQVARRTAVDVVRREARRQMREQVASQLDDMNATNEDWTQLEPLLDEAMHVLDEADRTAVLLRYFENKSLREVGETLGTNEDAARKRVNRAIERLRGFFTKRGLTVGAGALVDIISTNAVHAAPAGLAPAIAASATIAGTTAVTSATAVTIKSGVAAKGAASSGLLGGVLAMLGGIFVSLKAQADDTKSTRERQFLLQMNGIRIAAGLIILAAYHGIRKSALAQPPFGHDVVLATFLFVGAAMATVSFDFTRRGQRRIQIEEGTWIEAEWKKPRRETESSSSLDGNKSKLKSHLKAAGFLAFFLVWSVIMAVEAPWKNDPVKALIQLAFLALALLLGFHIWRNRPRFQSIGGLIGMVYMCGITLIEFNIHQYKSGLGAANGTTSAEVILFNLVVMLVYLAFIGIYARKRKHE